MQQSPGRPKQSIRLFNLSDHFRLLLFTLLIEPGENCVSGRG